jgi:hypothetical protein
MLFSRPRSLPPLPVLLALLLAFASPRAGLAQSAAENVQIGQALYDQAMADMKAGNLDAACKKLEEAARIVPEGVGVKLTLGECYEAAGRLAAAWTAYGLAESAAANAKQADREKLAHDRVEALKPRLCMLTVTVPSTVEALAGLEVKRDGVPVGPAQWNLPLPADKGKHTITATAKGRKSWEQTVELTAEGQSLFVEVGTPPPDPQASATATATVTVTAPATATAAPSGGAPSGAGSGQRAFGIVAAGAGLAGVVAGAIAGGIAISTLGASNAPGKCLPDDRCTPAGADLRRTSLMAGDVSTALFIGGGVALAAGVAVYLTAARPSAAARPTGAAGKVQSVALVLTPSGVALDGRF